jgi:NADPH-ferrihemoprotein reductase
VNRELRQVAGVGNSTRHVEIDLANTGVKYRTADNLYLCPDNDHSVVVAVAVALGYDLDMLFSLEPVKAEDKPKPLFPTPCTVRTALTRYCDLGGKPRKELLQHLSTHASLEEERKRLALLASKAGEHAFAEWVVKAERSVAEVLTSFPSLRGKLPLDVFFSIVPRLQPRAYTIASCSDVFPTSVHVCASVLDSPKPTPASDAASKGRRLQGVCSNYLLRLATEQSPRVRMFVRPSTFHLPDDASKPVVLVGPGTGIAPMRAFLQERQWQRKQGKRVGSTIMFFGCKHRDEDYIYRDELEAYCRDGTITMLQTAFSREQAHKVYVQHLIEQQGETVWQAVAKQEGHVYVCGATRMGSDVMSAIGQVRRRSVLGLAAPSPRPLSACGVPCLINSLIRCLSTLYSFCRCSNSTAT